MALLLGSVLPVLSCSAERSDSGTVATINLGTVPSTANTLIYIAQERGFFAAHGLRVNILNYDTGAATTGDLLQGKVDIAWVAEFPLVSRAFAREQIGIIAAIGKFEEQQLFARKDLGISSIADLKGKRIGIPLKTIAEFYTGRFLELNGMNIKEITPVDVKPPQALEAIAGGKVEGVVAWEPYVSQIGLKMADRVIAWPVQSNQPGYGLLSARKEWINSRPEIITRFLKSLALAEDDVMRRPGPSKSIVRKYLDIDEAFMEAIWARNQFSLFLDQSLITAMEDEARWMIENNLTAEKQVPNFLDYIYEYALKKIKPEAVDIIR